MRQTGFDVFFFAFDGKDLLTSNRRHSQLPGTLLENSLPNNTSQAKTCQPSNWLPVMWTLGWLLLPMIFTFSVRSSDLTIASCPSEHQGEWQFVLILGFRLPVGAWNELISVREEPNDESWNNVTPHRYHLFFQQKGKCILLLPVHWLSADELCLSFPAKQSDVLFLLRSEGWKG